MAKARGLAKIEKLTEGRNKGHTYMKVTVVIPTGQNTLGKKDEDVIRKIFRADCPFNFTAEESQEELWKDKTPGKDKNQGELDAS